MVAVVVGGGIAGVIALFSRGVKCLGTGEEFYVWRRKMTRIE